MIATQSSDAAISVHPGHSVSSSNARCNSGALSRAPKSAGGLNELSSGACPRHSLRTHSPTARPVSFSVPGLGLISTSSAKPLPTQNAASASKLAGGSPA